MATPSDTLRGRASGSRLKLWVLMDANRHHIAAGLLGAVFLVLVGLGVLDPVGIRSAMQSKDPVETTFQGFITAIITGVTLVVTINQLVLSQELGAVGDQRERMEGAIDFREDVETVLDQSVAPADPATFLQAIVEAVGERGETVSDRASAATDEGQREAIREYAANLVENATSVSDRLEGSRFGTFEVLSAALNFNYSWKIYEARRLQRERVEPSDEVTEALEDVVVALELYGPAREHFKTLYFQWELINLSRAVLYSALPSLVVATSMILYVDTPAAFPGETFGVDNIVWVVSAAVTTALVPFVLLLSYILRIATVTKRTLAIGPFVLRDTEGSSSDDSNG